MLAAKTKIILLIIVFGSGYLLTACTRGFYLQTELNPTPQNSAEAPNEPDGPQPPVTPVVPVVPIIPPPPIVGSFCTVSTLYSYEGPNTNVAPFAIACLQADGTWQKQIEYTVLPPFDYSTQSKDGEHFCYQPSLALAANGDFLVSFVCDNVSTWMARYVATSGWQAPVRVDSAIPPTGNRLSGVTQFGGFVTEYNGTPMVFWSTSNWGPTVSSIVGAAVTHASVVPPPPTGLEQDDCYSLAPFEDPLTKILYVYCGNPAAGSAKVFKLLNGSYQSLGDVPTSNPLESTQYTMLSQFNGQLVLAYSATEHKDWATTVWVTRVAVLTNSGWQVISPQLEDTPGHEGTRPFVFTKDGELHAMYFDYSTEGLPTLYNRIIGRYRVKKWNGLSWSLLPGESEAVYFSQRNEFLVDSGKVLFAAIRYNRGLSLWQKVVIGWNSGQFSLVGDIVKSCNKYAEECDITRPGAIIKRGP